jgi:tRNA nucleotidyltransferase (CCA-adding enzyme)
MQIFCVGGAVRDALLSRPAGDVDFVVLGSSDQEFTLSFPQAQKVGQYHPVFLLKGRQYTVSQAQDIDHDLHDRDLTINALAMDDRGYLYAHPLAVSDLARKILRPVAHQNFFADPLRVIRAARFKAMLPDFRLPVALRNLMTRVARSGSLEQVASERVGREVRLACQSTRPGHFVRVLAAASCLGPWLEELADTRWTQTARFMDRLSGSEQRVWMAMVHTFTVPGNHQDTPGPNTSWATLAANLGKRLHFPKNLIAAGRLAASWQQAAGNYEQLEPSLRIRMLLDLYAHKAMDDFWNLIRVITGKDLAPRAQAELQAILDVRLPEDRRNQGRRSGEYLHFLRCQALEQKVFQ